MLNVLVAMAGTCGLSCTIAQSAALELRFSPTKSPGNVKNVGKRYIGRRHHHMLRDEPETTYSEAKMDHAIVDDAEDNKWFSLCERDIS